MSMHKLEVYGQGEEPIEVYDLVGVCLRDLKTLMGGWVGDPGMPDRVPVYPEHAAFFAGLLGLSMDFEGHDYYVLVERGGVSGWLDDDFGDPAFV